MNSIAAIHEHANHVRTVGMGELVAVLNGVEFRTRHNDYKVVQPNTTEPGSQIDYDSVTDIPFPEVPQDVTDKETLHEQVIYSFFPFFFIFLFLINNHTILW